MNSLRTVKCRTQNFVYGFLFAHLTTFLLAASSVFAQTTAPATQPTTQPLTNTAIVGLKNVGGIAFAWVPDQAGGVVHVDAVDLKKNPIADPTLSYAWNFGDPGSSYNILPAGWNAGHLYDRAGTFTVTLTVGDGVSYRTFTAPVVIKPDTRRVVHAKTAADVVAAVKGGNVRVLVMGKTTYQFTGAQTVDLTRTRNVTVESEGVGQAVFSLAASPTAFTYWDTVNSLVRNIRFVGDPTIIEHFLNQNFSQKWPGWIRGNNSAVVGCTFANLLEGIQTQPGCKCMYFSDNAADNSFSIWNTCLWAEGDHLVCLGNNFPGSPWENPLRIADTGVVRGLVAYTQIREPKYAPPYLQKATFTFRTVQDLYVYGCTATDSWMGFEPRSNDKSCNNVVVDSCTFNNAMLIFRASTKFAKVRNNVFNEYIGGPGISADLIRGPTTVNGVEVYKNTFNLTQARPALGYENPDPKNPKDMTKYGIDPLVYIEHDNVYKVIPKQVAPPLVQ